ncbi:unnamed protein product [Cylicocyclus nassatus]|uniref:Uncharacterized protein n=1 Tax=Cylicocyclus nassatus TaxID=53992 RepID=A0AA36H7F5_CYLNA|nr:unnamed protein product [Cylicocyclus nassatus]
MFNTTLLLALCTIFFILYLLNSSSPTKLTQSLTGENLDSNCSCAYKNVVYDFCYHLPRDWAIKGKRFSCEFSSYLDELGMLSKTKVVDMTSEEMPKPPFVTAMSENHYLEGLTLIANFRSLWPRQEVIVYDLGLTSKSKKELQKKCLVKVRSFPFEAYPHYVNDLTQYRWKPLLIAMMLKEFGALWYMDTSVRWKSDRRDIVYSEITCRNKAWKTSFASQIILSSAAKIPKVGEKSFFSATTVTPKCRKPAFLLHFYSGHSIFAVTHPGMYSYIPTDIDKIKATQNLDANFAFVVRTADALEILKWYVLCALEEDCMAPYRAKLSCNFKNDRYISYAGCHRYDQSAINLLLANAYGYNATNYMSNIGHGATIQRTAADGLTELDFSCKERIEKKKSGTTGTGQTDIALGKVKVSIVLTGFGAKPQEKENYTYVGKCPYLSSEKFRRDHSLHASTHSRIGVHSCV